MSDIENPPGNRQASPTQRLASLEGEVRAVLDEWKVEKSAIESQRAELAALRDKVGRLVGVAKKQLRQEAEVLLQPQQHQYARLVYDYSSQKSTFDQLVAEYSSQKGNLAQLVDDYSSQKGNLAQLVDDYTSQKGNLAQLVDDYTSQKGNLAQLVDDYTSQKSTLDQLVEKSKLLTQKHEDNINNFNTEFQEKKNEVDKLCQEQEKVFIAAQRKREKENDDKILKIMNDIRECFETMACAEEEAKKLVIQINEIIPGAATVKLGKSFQKALERYGPK